MEAIYIYGIKSAGLIALFYLLYILFLQKETFFTQNRFFLLFGLLISATLPLYTVIKTIDITPIYETFKETETFIKTPISQVNTAIVVEKVATQINWFLIVSIIYSIGFFVLIAQFFIELYKIYSIIRNTKIEKKGNALLVSTTKKIAPFSFFNWIVFNTNLHGELEIQDILAHEKIHSLQLHSLDVLFARLFSIVFWFNPIVWLYKKAIVQNLEFIADFEAVKTVSNKKNYQFTLLKVTTHQNCVALSNHFYQSLIKKRIVMLNKIPSKSWQSWKYAIVFPLLIVFVFQFQTKVVAQIKEPVSKNSFFKIVKISKNTTDADLKEECGIYKKIANIDLKFYNIKRNKAGAIQNISASFNDNDGSKSDYNQKKSNVIDDFYFIYEKKHDGKIQIGFKDDLSTLDIAYPPLPPMPPMPPMPKMKALPPMPPMPPMTQKFENKSKSENIKIIVIDVSHGGNDSGASSDGFFEKDITLAIAKKIKSLIVDPNIEIVFTRSDNEAVSLTDRVEKINQTNPSFALSLHVNASSVSTKNGFEIYLNNENPFYKESLQLSGNLLAELSEDTSIKVSIQNARFMVLRKSNCPSLMLEMGYITNESDRSYLTSEEGQNKIAAKIARFIQN